MSLECRGVSKRFGALNALKDVTFELHGDKIKGLVGPNGSGKTTLVNVITGVPYRAEGGTISFNGRNIQRLSAREICRLGICRTFQAITVFPSLTVEQNVLVGAKSVGRNDNVVHDALDLTGLSQKKASFAAKLPLFEVKNLMIATALGVDPKLVILDEPLSGLSEEESVQTLDIIKKIRESGRAVLLIEHKLAKVLDLCDELLVLHLGKVIGDGEPRKTIQTHEVLTAYLGETLAQS